MNFKSFFGSLPEVNRTALLRYRNEYVKLRTRGDYPELLTQCKNVAKGYLICMRDSGVVTDVQFRRLLVWMTI